MEYCIFLYRKINLDWIKTNNILSQQRQLQVWTNVTHAIPTSEQLNLQTPAAVRVKL